MLDLLEQVDPTLLGSRAALRSGWLSVRALAKLLKGSHIISHHTTPHMQFIPHTYIHTSIQSMHPAHLVGDLSAYAKALEVMVTLSEQQPFSAAIAEAAGQGDAVDGTAHLT